MLTPLIAELASDLLSELLNASRRVAEQMEHAATDEELEDFEEVALELIQRRMQAWACLVAIEETVLAIPVSANPGLQDAVTRLLDALEAFDAAIYMQRQLLSVVATTYLLENWRNSLAPSHAEALPWWLDGTLEEIALAEQDETLALQPGEEVWNRLRNTVSFPRPTTFQAPTPLRLDDMLPLTMAAGVESPLIEVQFWSPDGRYFALLVSDRNVARPRVINFYKADGTAASDLVGKAVSFCGMKSVIDDQCNAPLVIEELRRADGAQPLVLVGPEDIVWERES